MSADDDKKRGSVQAHYLVTQSNKLVEAMYRMRLNEKKLFACTIAQIEPTDKDFKYYWIPVRDFKELIGIKNSNKNYFTVLVKAAKALRNIDFTINEETSRVNVGLVSAVKEEKADQLIGIRFDKELKPYLLRLKENFTQVTLKQIMGFKSYFTIRMFEILKRIDGLRVRKKQYELDEFRKMMGVAPNQYKRFYDFRKKVLDVARKELETTKAEYSFTANPIKVWRTIKFIEIIVHRRNQVVVIDEQGGEIDMADIDFSEIPEDILAIIPPEDWGNDVLRDIKTNLDTKGHEYVLKNVAYTVSKKPDKFSSYLGNALKKNWGKDHNPYQQSGLFDYQTTNPQDRSKILEEGDFLLWHKEDPDSTKIEIYLHAELGLGGDIDGSFHNIEDLQAEFNTRDSYSILRPVEIGGEIKIVPKAEFIENQRRALGSKLGGIGKSIVKVKDLPDS